MAASTRTINKSLQLTVREKNFPRNIRQVQGPTLGANVVFIELICTIIMIRRSGTAGLAGRLVLNTSGVCILRLQISNSRLVLELPLGDVTGYKQPVHRISPQSLHSPPFSLRGVGHVWCSQNFRKTRKWESHPGNSRDSKSLGQGPSPRHGPTHTHNRKSRDGPSRCSGLLIKSGKGRSTPLRLVNETCCTKS